MDPSEKESSENLIDLTGILSQIIRCVDRLEGDFSVFEKRLAELEKRWEEGRFHLAMLGQFKRGKSTLLNALVGEPLLPTAVIPLTAIPTFVRYGEAPAATLFFEDDRPPHHITWQRVEEIQEFLSRYVTEKGNPKNRFGVAYVEVIHPASILKKGVVLIDTPGIGSTYRHNTEATLNFLSQCDAALFLVSADPPLTEIEVAFLKEVKAKVPRLFFILNKVDYLTPGEQKEVLAFLRRVLTEEAGIPDEVPIFCVSSKQGLEARIRGDQRLWGKSGLDKVDRFLVEFLAAEKSRALGEAIALKAAEVVSDVLMRLRLLLQSFELPLEDLTRRMALFEEKIQEIQRERLVFQDLLAGDHRRMHAFLEAQAEQLRVRAKSYLEGVVREAVEKMGEETLSEAAIQSIIDEALPGYFEHQTGIMASLFRQKTAEVLKPHHDRADALIETVRHTAAELFEIPYRMPKRLGDFDMVQQPYWVTHKWSSRLSPIPEGLVDRFRSFEARKRRLLRQIHEQIGELVVTNVEHLRWAIYQSIDDTFRRFGSALDERMQESLAATQGAIRAAMIQRQTQGVGVEETRSQINTVIEELVRILSTLHGVR